MAPQSSRRLPLAIIYVTRQEESDVPAVLYRYSRQDGASTPL
jgi:hypothetical protein